MKTFRIQVLSDMREAYNSILIDGNASDRYPFDRYPLWCVKMRIKKGIQIILLGIGVPFFLVFALLIGAACAVEDLAYRIQGK